MKTTEQQHNERKKEIMEKCFECYAENGLTGTGIKALAEACGCTKANLYSYFKNLDELITESTAYCMAKVEDEFMQKAPRDPKDVMRFIEEVPYWTAREHGKKYRLMYQIYTHPKYIEYGKKFFEGVNKRYTEYAKQLEPKIGIPYTTITPLIFIFVRASVHYAMFEDEYYLKSQMEVLKQGVELFADKYSSQYLKGVNEQRETGCAGLLACLQWRELSFLQDVAEYSKRVQRRIGWRYGTMALRSSGNIVMKPTGMIL